MKKYQMIYEQLVSDINNKVYLVGDKLDSEHILAERFDTSRATVRRSLLELENAGLIMKQQGKESIVVSNTIKPKIVLLILPNLFKYIFIDLIKHIQDALRKENINLLIACSYNDQKIERDLIRNYVNTVDAIIIEPTQVQFTKNIHTEVYSLLTTIPTVCINTQLEGYNLPSIIVDDFNSTVELTREVISRGANRILILAKTDDLQGFNRLQGIKSVLEDNSDITYRSIEFSTYDEEQKISQFANIYSHYKPDTIMFYNDEYAYKFLSQNNINPIFDDIIITGFDDTDYSNGKPFTFLSPNHPKSKMGDDAATMIMDLLAGKTVNPIIYPPLLELDK